VASYFTKCFVHAISQDIDDTTASKFIRVCSKLKLSNAIILYLSPSGNYRSIVNTMLEFSVS